MTLYINPDNYSPDEPYSSEKPDEKYIKKKQQQQQQHNLRTRANNLFYFVSYL
jgi:hypothetical protein